MSDSETSSEESWPGSVEAAVERLLASLSEQD